MATQSTSLPGALAYKLQVPMFMINKLFSGQRMKKSRFLIDNSGCPRCPAAQRDRVSLPVQINLNKLELEILFILYL